MIKLSINTELVTPFGGFDYDSAIDRLLGAPPSLDDLSLFIREVAQNSWDARIKNGPVNDVNFEIELGAFKKTQADAFKKTVFTGEEYANKLIEKMNGATAEGQPYIIVRDSGTVGLNGPTEANIHTEGKKRFVSFVRNIGQANHEENDGGTYGFGKSVFFRYSNTRTFITYTRTHDEEGRLTSRLIGMTLNKEFMPANMQCTGRHWWGVKPPGRNVNYNQPITGDQADTLASLIGFRAYDSNETGTSVLVVSPTFPFDNQNISLKSYEGRKTVAKAISETLNAWYWPRIMGSGDRNGKIIGKVICDKEIIELPPLDQSSPLDLYATAFEEIQNKIANPNAETNPQVLLRKIVHGRNHETYGYIAIFQAARKNRPPCSIQQLKERHPLSGIMWGSDNRVASSNHVALIRNQGQVIRYLETVPSARPTQEYGAVFYLHPTGTNAAEINREIKASEQAAHDDWSTTKSPRAAYIIRKIIEIIEERVAPNIANVGAGLGSTGRVSLMLAGLWGDAEAPGGVDEPPTTPPTPPPSPSTDNYKIISEFKHGLYIGQKCIFVEAKVPKGAKVNASIVAYISTRNEISGSTDETKKRALGWFNTEIDPKTPAKSNVISSDAKLNITQNIIGKKVTLVVLNTDQHGLSVELKYS